MAFKLASRTRQYVTSTGTIDVAAVLNLGGVTNIDLNSFVASVGDGNQTIVCVASGNGIDWQECVVTIDDAAPDTLTVDAVIVSSIAGVIGTLPITLAGTSRVFGVIPTDFSKLFDHLFSATNASLLARVGGAWAGFAPGADGKILGIAGGVLAWVDPPAGGAAELDDLSDVVITTPSTNDILKFNGTVFANAAFPAIPSTLDNLSDVVITSPATGQVIAYNGTNFVNATLPAIPVNLDDLGDVIITSPAVGHYIRYNGSNFVNAAFPSIPATLDDLSDTIISGATSKSYLRYNGTNWINDDIGYFRSILVEDENNANGTTGTVDNYISTRNGTTAFPFYALRQHGGTKASPTAIISGTVLGAYGFYGYDGTVRGLGPTIQAVATEAWTPTAHGAKLIFSYVPIGGTVPNFSLSLDESGFSLDGNSVYSQTHSPYTFGLSAPQTAAYSASQVIGHHPAMAAFTIPANFGSTFGLSARAGGTVNATGSTVFSVDRAVAASPNTFTQIGTITFAAGTVTPTFATVSGTAKAIAAGDVIRVVGPATPDATFAGFYGSFVGSRT